MTARSIDAYAWQIHETAIAHGFWDSERNFGEMVALMHSELSEALEAHRSGKPVFYMEHEEGCEDEAECICVGGPKPEGTAVELVDAIIRELDTLHNMLQRTGYSIEGIMRLKMAYNDKREHKHGKGY